MPNWVTNELKASAAVIAAAVNQSGNFDFSLATPSPCPFGSEWNGIYGDAETAAEAVIGKPLSSHPLMRSLEARNRADIDIKKLNDESFEQFVGMLRNHRACGYLHDMDFARDAWGTKWNACESSCDIAAGTARFETAWSCPRPVFAALSKRFPDEVLTVAYADEDIGSNCGTFKLKNGEVIESDEANSWSDMTEDERTKWRAFAYQVKGWTPDEDEDE